jgi:hypothetical protein
MKIRVNNNLEIHQFLFTSVMVMPNSPPSGGDKNSPADGCDRGAFIV